MKVFNWAHWRFFNIRSDPIFMQEDGKRSSRKVDFEKHALLEQDDGHDHVVNNWENDILATGTLGIGPLDEDTQTQHHDEIIKEIVLHDDYDHHLEENNNHTSLNHDLLNDKNDDDDDIRNDASFRHELEKTESGCKEIEVVEDSVQQLKESNESKKNECQVTKKRVTLADLFSEDCDHVHTVKEVEDDCAQGTVADVQKPSSHKTKKRTARAKTGLTKAKRLLKDDFRPLDIVNQLMRRMINKKIHPHMEGKMHKDIQMQANNDETVGPHQPPSLLLIPDVILCEATIDIE